MNYVFYKGTLYSEYDPRLKGTMNAEPRIQPFSWIYNSQQRRWYYMERSTFCTNIPESEVPAEYRTYALILTN